VHIGVVNYLAGMEISTIVIANVHMLCANLYDPSYVMTKCVLIVTIDREWRSIIAMYYSVEQEQRLCFTGALGTYNVFSLEGCHGDEMLLL